MSQYEDDPRLLDKCRGCGLEGPWWPRGLCPKCEHERELERADYEYDAWKDRQMEMEDER